MSSTLTLTPCKGGITFQNKDSRCQVTRNLRKKLFVFLIILILITCNRLGTTELTFPIYGDAISIRPIEKKNKHRLQPSANYISLPLPNASLPKISFGACCGIGHRMSNILMIMVYGISNSQLMLSFWRDVNWNIVFNNSSYVKQGN